MEPRLDYHKANPEAYKAMLNFEIAVNKLGLEESLLELIRLRASQINGCAYCVDLHAADARKAGETERRLYSLSVWREAPFYTPRERAALAWTEALTDLSHTHAPDADYKALLAEFSPAESVAVTMAINAINSWNRIGVGYRKVAAAD
ncbi:MULTISPECIES: carboxymuconolactone decarboxylase family protein [unclassified Massilia]|uniref:carboxymuconolactone decarboxylase family protein n=1 Tax=unclassified Massilia TaxID=2609279 RepID=UPI00159481DA|nr:MULTISPECIES: carboxymuconolactone decarboxylase family protein [unclassified Massilia]NVD99407.1 carboxymuconolactone decarboxylase family protein [Massilia sp. BJB1822]UTY59058.1 carboxymuconolactone decarboxylase family protein [Massilia sp. erpn]